MNAQVKASRVAPALQALLERFIDYAGLFPPASVSLDGVLSNYDSYRGGEHSWMLRWLVVPAAELNRVPKSFDGMLSVLAENDEPRAAAIESKRVISAVRPVYCEVPTDRLADLAAVKESGCLAKIRMGGVQESAIPSCPDVAAFIAACAERRLPFKATAGLHHPVRAPQPLTYEDQAPRAVMHGFLNVLLAAAFAWHGERDLEPVLSESDPAAFSFDDRAHWRDRTLDVSQIRDARTNFIHSVGSCSFDEPVRDLQSLRLLPC